MPQIFEWKTLGVVYVAGDFSDQVNAGTNGWDIVNIQFNTNNSEWFFLLRRAI